MPSKFNEILRQMKQTIWLLHGFNLKISTKMKSNQDVFAINHDVTCLFFNSCGIYFLHDRLYLLFQALRLYLKSFTHLIRPTLISFQTL